MEYMILVLICINILFNDESILRIDVNGLSQQPGKCQPSKCQTSQWLATAKHGRVSGRRRCGSSSRGARDGGDGAAASSGGSGTRSRAVGGASGAGQLLQTRGDGDGGPGHGIIAIVARGKSDGGGGGAVVVAVDVGGGAVDGDRLGHIAVQVEEPLGAHVDLEVVHARGGIRRGRGLGPGANNHRLIVGAAVVAVGS